MSQPISADVAGSRTVKPASAVGTRRGRITFIIGGSLFIASSLVGLAITPAMPFGEQLYRSLGEAYFALQSAATVSAMVLFAAGLIVFAWGVRGQGSVVARRPLGVVALILFALWPLLVRLLQYSLPPTAWAGWTELGSYAFGWGVTLVAGVIGVIVIAVVRAVPGGWRWLPLCAFVFVAACAAAYPLILRFTPPVDAFAPIYVIPVIFALYGGIVASLLLGIIAIGLAVAARPRREQSALPLTDPAGAL